LKGKWAVEFFTELGFVGLFLSAFLAATVLPLSSEVVLSALILSEFNVVWLVIIATAGNVLGSVTNYLIGLYGGDYLRHKFLKISDETFNKTRQRFEKWGLASLLFAWVPVIGDPLTLMAGVLRVNFIWFILLVTTGKLFRYMVLAYGVTSI